VSRPVQLCEVQTYFASDLAKSRVTLRVAAGIRPVGDPAAVAAAPGGWARGGGGPDGIPRARRPGLRSQGRRSGGAGRSGRCPGVVEWAMSHASLPAPGPALRGRVRGLCSSWKSPPAAPDCPPSPGRTRRPAPVLRRRKACGTGQFPILDRTVGISSRLDISLDRVVCSRGLPAGRGTQHAGTLPRRWRSDRNIRRPACVHAVRSDRLV
jgi:hypothetical protein